MTCHGSHGGQSNNNVHCTVASGTVMLHFHGGHSGKKKHKI